MDPTTEHRARLARWVVALRRAHIAGTPQGTGALHGAGGYCCLGIWCRIGEAAGLVESTRREDGDEWWRSLGRTDPESGWVSTYPPAVINFRGGSTSADPIILTAILRVWPHLVAAEVFASTANDVLHLTFDQIADCVIYEYALTADELATADLAPRVESVEGPAPTAEENLR